MEAFMTRRYVPYLMVAAFGGLLLVFAGCTKTGDSKSPPMAVPKAEKDTHGHKSTHGGRVFSVGQDNYHVDAVFEKGGWLRLYTLDQDESKAFEVEAKPVTGFAKAVGETDSVSLTFKP